MTNHFKCQSEIESDFEHLNSANYTVTSCKDPRYNCLAWAVGDIGKKWDPLQERGYYWPPGIGREGTVEECVEIFKLHGYEDAHQNFAYEVGYERVAIFEDETGWSHIARQLRDGKWSSKLGKGADIEHLSLQSLEGPEPAYGKLVRCLRKRRLDWN